MGSPTYDYRPDFTPGDEPCRIPIYSRTRARSIVGGTYFRSIRQGSGENAISIQAEWLDNLDMPTFVYNDVVKVRLTVSKAGLADEVYEGLQSWDDMASEWISSAIPGIRNLVNANSLIIQMPGPGSDINYDPEDPTEDAMTFFSTQLSGGSGGPATPNPSIRTGPERSLIFIATEEGNNGQPGAVNIQKILEWNGSAWVEFSS